MGFEMRGETDEVPNVLSKWSAQDELVLRWLSHRRDKVLHRIAVCFLKKNTHVTWKDKKIFQMDTRSQIN